MACFTNVNSLEERIWPGDGTIKHCQSSNVECLLARNNRVAVAAAAAAYMEHLENCAKAENDPR